MSEQTDLNPLQQVGRDAHFADDEINLFDLVKDVQQQFHWLVGFTVLFAVLGLAYALTATPVYQVESRIKPSAAKYLTELNSPELAEIYSLKVDGAFAEAKSAVFSQEYRREYYKQQLEKFKASELYKDELTFSQNYQKFNEDFKVSVSNEKKDAEDFLKVSLQLTHAELATDFVNGYISYALQRRLSDIHDEIESKRFNRIDKLKLDADLLRDTYFNSKTRRKLNLEEAQQIAKAVGQIEPVYSKSDILGSFQPPLYMYGLKALEAEEKAMNSREKMAGGLPHGEEHFIAGLPKILFDIRKLESISVDYDKVKLAQIDEPALQPFKPIKPKKALIVILATMAGGFIGLMMALVLAAYKRYKKEH